MFGYLQILKTIINLIIEGHFLKRARQLQLTSAISIHGLNKFVFAQIHQSEFNTCNCPWPAHTKELLTSWKNFACTAKDKIQSYTLIKRQSDWMVWDVLVAATGRLGFHIFRGKSLSQCCIAGSNPTFIYDLLLKSHQLLIDYVSGIICNLV